MGAMRKIRTKPRGPSFGAKEDAEPTSPPIAFNTTIFSSPAAGGGPIFSSYAFQAYRVKLSH